MIEGSNIYKDRFVFIREVIQNAMDASKLQLWKDLCARNYLAWEEKEDPLDEEKLKHLQPYDLQPEIYQNYPVEVKLSTPASGQVEIEVSDRGTGISVDAFKRMCNVGESNESSARLKKIIREMPNWLRPTAGFGIGLQSIFLVADRFEIDTSTGQEAFHAVVHSRREGGYLQLQRANRVMPRGTTIRIRTNVINDFSYPIGYETSRYLKFYLDPIDPKNRIREMHILDIALEISDASLFPLHVTCQEQLIEDSHSSGNRRKFWDNTWDTWHDDRYRYKIEENGGVLLLWDTKEAVCTEFRLSGYGLRGFEVYFKGIKVDKQSFHARERICSAMDLYGLDTRQTITLDRESLTREGSQRVKDLYRQYLEVYKKIFLKQIEEKKYQNFGRLDFYTLWLFCSDQQRERIPQSLIEEIKDEVAVVVRGEDSKYLEQSRPIRDIIKNIERQWYIDVDEFRIYDNGRDTYDFPKICAILNNAAEGARPLYIADLELEKNEKSTHWMDQVCVVSVPPYKPLLCYTLKAEQGTIQALETQQDRFLRGLGEPIAGCSFISHVEKKAKRYAIPALEGYETIAVRKIRNGFTSYPDKLRAAWIVSPFTREDLEAYEKLKPGKEAFAEQILKAKNFSWVVDWVQKYHLGNTVPTQAEISHCYRKLIYAYCEALEKTKSDKEEHKPLE